MPSRTHKPSSQTLAGSSASTTPGTQRQRRHRLISLGYVLGLLLIFILSLLLLPTDTGLGKLLWSTLPSAGH